MASHLVFFSICFLKKKDWPPQKGPALRKKILITPQAGTAQKRTPIKDHNHPPKKDWMPLDENFYVFFCEQCTCWCNFTCICTDMCFYTCIHTNLCYNTCIWTEENTYFTIKKFLNYLNTLFELQFNHQVLFWNLKTNYHMIFWLLIKHCKLTIFYFRFLLLSKKILIRGLT